MKILKINILFLCFVVCTAGCAAYLGEQLSAIGEDYRNKNQQISLSMGERDFDLDKTQLMKATINMFANKNCSVVTIDKDIGYILAEGSGFLSPEKYRETAMKNVDELNKRTTVYWRFTPGNDRTRIAVNFFEKANGKIRMKVGVSNAVTGYGMALHELHPDMTTAIYDEYWRELDKAIFLYLGTK